MASKEKLGKVLIVAGSADAMMNYQMQLSAYSTETALNSEAATDLLDDIEPDVIIIDEKLPGSTGAELAQWIRGDQAAPHYYSILIVAQGKNRDLSELIKSSSADTACIYDHAKQDLAARVDLLLKLKTVQDRSNALTNKLSHAKETIRDLEDQDSITRLYNLPYVTARLDKEIRHAERFSAPLSFMILSIDNFTTLAQERGTTFMTKALQQLANDLIHITRADDIVGRSWAGDFYLILPETKPDGAQNLQKRILAVIQEKLFGLDNESLGFEFTFGQASIQGELAVSCKEMMRKAELNLNANVREKTSQKPIKIAQ